jgi:hypothetical protein
MSASMDWRGLDELAEALRTLPDSVQREAEGIVRDTATLHVAAARVEFPAPGRDLTGNLRAGNIIEAEGPLTYRVRNVAPHAWLYEHDHAARGVGPNAPDGRVRGRYVFVSSARDLRRQMLDRLRALVPLLARGVGLQTR